jgi:hypothetical protein
MAFLPPNVLAGLAAGVQLVFLFQVFSEGAAGAISAAEIVMFAPDFLGPSPHRVGEEREVGVGLGRLAGDEGRGRITLGYGD